MARIGVIAVECSEDMRNAVVDSLNIATDPADLARRIEEQNTPGKIAARSERLARYRESRVEAEFGHERGTR